VVLGIHSPFGHDVDDEFFSFQDVSTSVFDAAWADKDQIKARSHMLRLSSKAYWARDIANKR
jgi:hypothetical protein